MAVFVFYRIPLDFLQKEWMYRGVMLRIMSPGRFCLHVRKPSARSCRTMFSRFSPSRRPCAVRRTIFPPARSIRSIWATLAAVSLVSVLVIDWQATGCPPPITTPPMRTSHAGRRLNSERFTIVLLLSYKDSNDLADRKKTLNFKKPSCRRHEREPVATGRR